MKNKDKENALNDFIEMIKNSWTYNRMSEEEREKLLKLLTSGKIEKILKGNYYARCEILLSIHEAFLIGLGYNDYNWREEKND